jgi:2'-hydroxyisoflavone reductase
MAAQVISATARDAGLYNRPIRETVRDLMSWWQTLPDERTAKLQAGVSPEYEAELISRWKERQA